MQFLLRIIRNIFRGYENHNFKSKCDDPEERRNAHYKFVPYRDITLTQDSVPICEPICELTAYMENQII